MDEKKHSPKVKLAFSLAPFFKRWRQHFGHGVQQLRSSTELRPFSLFNYKQADPSSMLKAFYSPQACSSEVMMLRVVRRYNASTDSIMFANNQAYTRDTYRKAGMTYVIEDLLHFCRCMYSLAMDNVHYALLTAVVIFSGG